MSHQKIYSEFMAIIQDEVCIRTLPKKYGSQSRHIKDLISKFESAQKYKISNKQNNMVENSNQNHIFQWEFAHIHCNLFHQSYTE